MIEKKLIEEAVCEALAGGDAFPVSVSVDKADNVVVTIDSLTGVDMDTCAALNRRLQEVLDATGADYSLEVGSAGITSPLVVPQQYVKNLGREVVVLTSGGKKLRGVLTDVKGDSTDTLEITVSVPTKVRREGAKRPAVEQVPTVLKAGDWKSVTPELSFK